MRNANRILRGLSDYLGCFYHGKEKVYHLNKKGRERIGCEIVRKKTPNIQHFLVRNQFYIYMRRPSGWENEIKIKAGNLSMICDAEFRLRGGKRCFVEVDISQPLIKNRAKIDRYKKLKEMTNDAFDLIWVTELESRRHKLSQLCEGLAGRVFTLNDII